MAKTAAKIGARKTQGKSPSLRGRLQSWMGGGNQVSKKMTGAKASGAPSSRIRDRRPVSETAQYWTPSRIELVQHIWGPGYTTAGGEEYLRELIEPLDIAEGISVLDALAGLGGAARYLAEEISVRVEGYETSVELAAAGMRLSTEEDLASTASVRHYNPQTIEFRQGVYDLVIARDLIRLVDDKAMFLGKLRQSLKPGGTLLLTDLAYGHSGTPGGEVKAWMKQEPVRTRPWNKGELGKVMQNLGLEIGSLDDDTDAFKAMIIESWGAFRGSLATIEFEQEINAELIEEGDRWMRYVDVLEGGDLRYYRIVAKLKG